MSSSWSTIDVGTTTNTNWATDQAGTTDRMANPGADSTVFFSTANATGPSISTTLDHDFTINDLVFLASPTGVTSVTIAQGTQGTLTIAPANSADGIEVQSNAGSVVISAPVALGGAQLGTFLTREPRWKSATPFPAPAVSLKPAPELSPSRVFRRRITLTPG